MNFKEKKLSELACKKVAVEAKIAKHEEKLKNLKQDRADASIEFERWDKYLQLNITERINLRSWCLARYKMRIHLRDYHKKNSPNHLFLVGKSSRKAAKMIFGKTQAKRRCDSQERKLSFVTQALIDKHGLDKLMEDAHDKCELVLGYYSRWFLTIRPEYSKYETDRDFLYLLMRNETDISNQWLAHLRTKRTGEDYE